MKKKTFKKNLGRLKKATYATMCTDFYQCADGTWKAEFICRRPKKALNGRTMHHLLWANGVWEAFNQISNLRGLTIPDGPGLSGDIRFNPDRKYYIGIGQRQEDEFPHPLDDSEYWVARAQEYPMKQFRLYLTDDFPEGAYNYSYAECLERIAQNTKAWEDEIGYNPAPCFSQEDWESDPREMAKYRKYFRTMKRKYHRAEIPDGVNIHRRKH